MKGLEPVARIRRSYSAVTTVPSLLVALTTRRTRSTSVTVKPVCSVMWLSAYHDQSLRMISSMVCSPASTGDSRMRL